MSVLSWPPHGVSLSLSHTQGFNFKKDEHPPHFYMGVPTGIFDDKKKRLLPRWSEYVNQQPEARTGVEMPSGTMLPHTFYAQSQS